MKTFYAPICKSPSGSRPDKGKRPGKLTIAGAFSVLTFIFEVKIVPEF
ncbi:MAG TPA: hypothetical protein VGB68_08480 [Pyrinomonadaceae bacterium]|jgi:hypothetical protein